MAALSPAGRRPPRVRVARGSGSGARDRRAGGRLAAHHRRAAPAAAGRAASRRRAGDGRRVEHPMVGGPDRHGPPRPLSAPVVRSLRSVRRAAPVLSDSQPRRRVRRPHRQARARACLREQRHPVRSHHGSQRARVRPGRGGPLSRRLPLLRRRRPGLIREEGGQVCHRRAAGQDGGGAGQGAHSVRDAAAQSRPLQPARRAALRRARRRSARLGARRRHAAARPAASRLH